MNEEIDFKALFAAQDALERVKLLSRKDLVAFALSTLKPEANEPCQSFVVLTKDDKQGTIYPDVVGPFESYRAAYKWIAELRNASIAGPDSHWAGSIYLEPPDGGYAGFVIVNEYTAVVPYNDWEGYVEEDEEE